MRRSAETKAKPIPSKDIDDWMWSDGQVPYCLGDAGDLLAVSVHGVVKPRKLAVVKRKTDRLGTLCVYLGGILPDPENLGTLSALFCDLEATANGEKLLSITIPVVELRSIARVLGTAAPDKPWRNLEKWKFPERELTLVQRLEAEQQLLVSPIQAFDITRLQDRTSVH
jgi:hypothetical protein